MPARDAHSRDQTHVPLTLARLLLFHRRLHGSSRTCRERGPVKTACESEQTLSVQRYMRLKNCETRSISKGGRWPCWIRFRLLPRPTALGERCSVLDTVSKRARTPPRSPIRARAGKCVLSVDAREKSASDTCEPPVTSKSRGRVYKLIDLVSSSSIDDTVRAFAVPVVLTWPLFPTGPPSSYPR